MLNKNNIAIRSFYGEEIGPYLVELAKLRIKVFYEFPYLYEGDLAYEKEYLKVYVNCPQSIMVIAFDGERIIGASTALPLNAENDYVKNAFQNTDYQMSDIYYFGESVLLKEYRGLKIGHLFFDEREKAAKKFGYKLTSFCSVERNPDHHLRPVDYRPHDIFWAKRGYVKDESINSFFSWKDRGENQESMKKMYFWIKK